MVNKISKLRSSSRTAPFIKEQSPQELDGKGEMQTSAIDCASSEARHWQHCELGRFRGQIVYNY